jgi:hypothetical protein
VCAVVVLACASLVLLPASGQQPNPKEKPYALIFGTVYGPDDRPFYAARVQVRRADGRKLKGGDLNSDHQGEFALRVPAGEADYMVHATARVGKRKLSADSKVHVHSDERMDVGLHLTE